MFKKLFGRSKSVSKEITVVAPLTGKVMKLEDVIDPVFAQKMMGDGLAIDPTEGVLVAPVSGKVVQFFHTKHAIEIETDSGMKILIHIGLETVKMNGEGFEGFVKQGDTVKAGQKLIGFSLDLIREKAKSTMTPIIVTNGETLERFELEYPETTVAGETPVMQLKVK